MEVRRVNEYQYDKVYLYPPVPGPEANYRPGGAVEIEVIGHRGSLVCQTKGSLRPILEKYAESRFPVFLSKDGDSEEILIGYLLVDSTGDGVYRWEFNTTGFAGETGQPVGYRLFIGIRPAPGVGQSRIYTKILLAGQFTLPYEVRDSRVVGLKKEVKAEPSRLQKEVKNPLFQKVEPFNPPIPNMTWWRISIQPDFSNNIWQKEYCPRQKKYKAVF